ncbi:MAG: hypothetical protein JW969_00360 [Spirochaetales bacterium]|nr:hypothetical protein [Spirochaetales bacterium]
MDLILDSIFSSGWLVFFCILFLIGFAVVPFTIKPFRKKPLNTVLRISFLFISFSIFVLGSLNSCIWGYKFVNKVSDMRMSDNFLCIIDQPTGMEDDIEGMRLHVLDPDTGKRFYRHVMEMYSVIYGLDGDRLLSGVGSDRFFVFELGKGRIVTCLNPETLPEMFPEELGMGIAVMSIDPSIPVITATSKVGYTYYVKPFSLEITTEKPEYHVKGIVWYSISTHIYRGENYFIKVIDSDSSGYLKQMMNVKTGTKTKFTYLVPKIVAVFDAASAFLVLHYETTDKIRFILTCLDFDMKVKWRITQRELNAIDAFTEKPTFNTCITWKDQCIFNAGGFLFSVNQRTGNIKWESRL